MNTLSTEGQKTVEELAQRYGVSSRAVTNLLKAVMAGGGNMAQFSDPELGGMGQWSRGGMTMVGDMFNNSLKAKVDGLCSDLADLLNQESSQVPPPTQTESGASASDTVSFFVPGAGASSRDWWGEDLGTASSTGSQNHIRYAFFPATRRLALRVGDHVTIYDTQDHAISGVSQQQSGSSSLTFVSQRGLIRVSDLPIISENDGRQTRPKPTNNPTPNLGGAARQEPPPSPQSGVIPNPKTTAQPDDVFSKLERLAELHTRGTISAEEFAAKKTDLLGQI